MWRHGFFWGRHNNLFGWQSFSETFLKKTCQKIHTGLNFPIKFSDRLSLSSSRNRLNIIFWKVIKSEQFYKKFAVKCFIHFSGSLWQVWYIQLQISCTTPSRFIRYTFSYISKKKLCPMPFLGGRPKLLVKVAHGLELL